MKNFLLWELIKNILVLEFINTKLSLLQLSYSPRKPDTIEEKKEVLINTGSLYNVRNKFIEVFEDRFFPFKDGFQEKELHVLNKKLPNWVRVNETFSDQIKDQVK